MLVALPRGVSHIIVFGAPKIMPYVAVGSITNHAVANTIRVFSDQ